MSQKLLFDDQPVFVPYLPYPPGVLKHRLLPLDRYDKIIVSLSGGKDSVAMLLWCLAQGIPIEKLEVFHQAIDGMGDQKVPFFDWPSTEGYVRALAKHYGITLSWQWRAYGFYGELMKLNARSHDIYYRNDEEMLVYRLATTDRAAVATRRKFPMKTHDLSRRWCSSVLKIEPARRVINNRADLQGTSAQPLSILWLTGERRQESVQRAKYSPTEDHPGATRTRLVHHLRPVLEWREEEVWRMLEGARIRPHPVYYLSFPRLSCRSCIFFGPDHWRTLHDIDPAITSRLRDVERELGFTIDNKLSIDEMIRIGKSGVAEKNQSYIKKAIDPWVGGVVVPSHEKWELPDGAFKGSGGGA